MAVVNGGDPPDFLVEITFDEGFHQGAIISFVGSAVLPPGQDYELFEVVYEIVGSAPDTAELQFCDNVLGNPPFALIFVVGNLDVIPIGSSGLVEISESVFFRRGDADENGLFNGLVHAVFTLNFQFAGGPAPICADAMDFDDDGVINGIVDGLAMLAFQFAGGPPPAAPGLCRWGPSGLWGTPRLPLKAESRRPLEK